MMENRKPQHLLIFRFSSLGDVAMTVPVIKCLLHQYPSLRCTMVSSAFMQPLFENIERLQFHAFDKKGKHKGIAGLYKLLKELKSTYAFDGVADLHNVLRTKILRKMLVFSPAKVAVMNKGRKEKKALTRRFHKQLYPLPSNFERYADVFRELGFPVQLVKEQGILTHLSFPLQSADNLKKRVGIAPFALHNEKTYPPHQMKEVIRLLSLHDDVNIFLFGGKNDQAQLQQWAREFRGVESVAGRMNLGAELQFMSGLDVMVSMDSANMHFASLAGIPVVSIWGGTHPYLGFYGWGQDPGNAVQIDLECRPSSVFGNKECYNHLACMKGISPLMVYEKIMQNLEKATT